MTHYPAYYTPAYKINKLINRHEYLIEFQYSFIIYFWINLLFEKKDHSMISRHETSTATEEIVSGHWTKIFASRMPQLTNQNQVFQREIF